MIGAPRQLQQSFLEQVGDLDEAQELAAAHRRFDCPRYDACLTYAATQPVGHRNPGWQGFSCFGCDHG